MTELTERQQQILDVIADSWEECRRPPTVREIAKRVGLSSTSTVQGHIEALVKAGRITRDPNSPRSEAGGAAMSEETTTYARTKGGKVVHLSTCRHVKASFWVSNWPWAEGKTPHQIAELSREHRVGLFFCGTCFPEVWPRGPW